MTPTRAKRNSKIPNRFSSDNARIETSNANGETIIDYNDKTTSTTNNLVPMNRSIKLKPAVREPLKVKLPKLKRPDCIQQQQQKQKQTKDSTLQSNTSEIKIHKIKLPSFKKINRDSSNQSVKTPSLKIALSKPIAQPKNQQDETSNQNNLEAKDIVPSPTNQPTELSSSQNSINKSSTAHNLIDCSASSKSSDEEEKSANVDSSFSSDQSSSGPMQMIVCPSEPTQGSSSGIRCPCGVNDDLGVMVECEKCSNWQHGHCINVGTEEEAYEGYICAYCSPPQDGFRESLLQLTVNDKFYSQFKILESLKKRDETISHENGTEENNARLTLQELYQATKDLNRVMGSLRVKWRLFELATQGVCEQELILWQNPYWSEEQLRNTSDDTCYIWARCRNNLELNIRHMINKMEERCELIHYGLSLARKGDQKTLGDNVHDSQRDDGAIRQSLEVLTYGLRDFKNKLKELKG